MRYTYFRRFWIFTLFILIGFSGCDDGSVSYDSTIVCLGNSLTAGYGTSPSFPYSDPSKAYPARLQQKVNREVINSGLSGVTTGGALTLLDSSVLNYDPVIVIIELGANDFFRETAVSETESNLQEIISYIDNGTRKIYLAKFYTELVGRAFLNEKRPGLTYEEQAIILENYDGMFSSLETDYGVELIEDIWSGIWGVHMYSDGIHPDATGYSIMADNYFNVMKPYLETMGFLK